MSLSQKGLSYITLGLLMLAGVAFSYAAMSVLMETGVAGNFKLPMGNATWYVITLLIVSLVLLLMAYVINKIQLQESEASRLIQWMSEVQTLLIDVHYPLCHENLYPLGEKITNIFPANKGWMMYVLSPGLLMKSELMRRKYIKIKSKEWVGESVWADRLLLGRLEDADTMSYGEVMPYLDTVSGKGLLWTHRSVGGITGGDLSVGIFVALPKTTGIEKSTLFRPSMDSVLSLLVKQLGVLLVDVLDRKDNANGEQFGLLVKAVIHELSSELQVAYSRLINEQLSVEKDNPQYKDINFGFKRIGVGLLRASQTIEMMRGIPYLQKNRLGVDRTEKIEFGEMIGEVLTEMSEAYPEVMFSSQGLISNNINEKIYLQAGSNVKNIFVNTIRNAASFTPQDGEVNILCSIINGQLKVVVSDEGPGVDINDVDALFEPSRGSNVRPDGSKGMGVGMSIARMIARAYGGDIKCIPNIKVEGGRFEILLPLARIGETEL